MGKYVIYEDKETGELSAHTEAYQKKSGEKKVGTAEGANADEALAAYESGNDEPDSDDDAESTALATTGDTDLVSAKDAEAARKVEASKKEFEVMQDASGRTYVKGGKSDPDKAKAKAVKEPAAPPEPGSLGKFRAKDEKEAIARATGTFIDPASGAQRGAQTP
jgi:hypothetical protein